jgi:hypothetical protein
MSQLRFDRILNTGLVGFICFFAAKDALHAQKQDPLKPLSVWDKSVNLRFGGGYKDNLLLSNVRTIASGFVATGIDLMVVRLPTDGAQFVFFLNGEDIRYLEGGPVDKEQTLIAVSQVKKDFAENWTVGLEAQYIYQDQVVDASTTETNQTVLAQGNGFSVRPTIRRDFSKNTWLELGLGVNRQYFKAPLDDYWEGGPKLTLGHEYGNRSEWTLSYDLIRRAYDNREQLTKDGISIAQSSLEFTRNEFDLTVRNNWDHKRRWRTTTKIGFELNEDNGSGYFDYKRYYVAQQLRFLTSKWELQGRIKFNYYDYAIQTVNDINPATRNRTGVILNLRGDRQLTKAIKLYGVFEHERVLSNRTTDQYRVNVVSGGVDWEF